MGLKDIYYSVEDSWYGFVERLNKVIPVQGLVDRIDRYAPSFILFLFFFLLLASGLAYYFLFMNASGGTATFVVEDDSGARVAGAAISLTFGGSTQTLLTEADGTVRLAVSGPPIDVLIQVTKEGFVDLSKTEKLEAKQFLLSLTANACEGSACLADAPHPILVQVVNSSTGRLVVDSIKVTFACDDGKEASPAFSTTSGKFVVPKFNVCNAITATVTANGFASAYKRFTSASPENDRLLLEPQLPASAVVNVRVVGDDTNAVPNVNLVLENTQLLSHDSGITGLSGAFSFSKVEPGSYHVIANAPDGRSATSDDFEVADSAVLTKVVVLPPFDSSRVLRLMVVDANSANPVANVRVLVYENSSIKYTFTTVQDGVLERPVAHPDANYTAIFIHPDYLLHAEFPLRLFPAVDKASVQTIKLIKRLELPVANYAQALVRVIDEDSVPVSRASVFLFDERLPRIPLNAEALYTSADGNVLFSRLEPGSYKAYAAKSDLNAVTGAQSIATNATANFTIRFVLGEGTVEASTTDSDGLKLGGVLVELFDSTTRELLASCTTGESSATLGKCTTPKIKADRFVIARASKTQYFSSFFPSIIDIVGGQSKKASFQLFPLSIVPRDPPGFEQPRNLFVRLSAICEDADCRRPVNVVTSDPSSEKTYYALFHLFMADSNAYHDISSLVRAGPDSIARLTSRHAFRAQACLTFRRTVRPTRAPNRPSIAGMIIPPSRSRSMLKSASNRACPTARPWKSITRRVPT